MAGAVGYTERRGDEIRMPPPDSYEIGGIRYVESIEN